jgi:hypothetical protein
LLIIKKKFVRYPVPEGIDLDKLEVADIEDLVYSIEDATELDEENLAYCDADFKYKTVKDFVRVVDPSDAVAEVTSLAYDNCLLRLAEAKIPTDCPHCGNDVQPFTKKVGTATYIIWVSSTCLLYPPDESQGYYGFGSVMRP